MPELPDVTIYVECLERLIGGEVLENLRVTNPFVFFAMQPCDGAMSAMESAHICAICGFSVCDAAMG